MFMTGMFPPFQPVEGRPGIMDINTMDGTYENMYPNPKCVFVKRQNINVLKKISVSFN